jgi:hypothetical protein
MAAELFAVSALGVKAVDLPWLAQLVSGAGKDASRISFLNIVGTPGSVILMQTR